MIGNLLNGLPWWAWAVPLAGAVGLAWHVLGNKGAIGAAIAAALALFGARSRQQGRETERARNNKEAWDAIHKANDARLTSDRRNADPDELRKSDGFRRD